MERIRTHFAEKGLSAEDVPKAIVMHELVSIAMAAASWTVRQRGSELDALPPPRRTGTLHPALKQVFHTKHSNPSCAFHTI